MGDQDKTTTPAAPAPASPAPEYIAAIQEAVRVANEPIVAELKESKQETARLQEALVLRDARDIVVGTLNRIPNVPDMTKARLVEVLAANPPVKDGKIDTEAFTTKITEAVTAELKYLAEASGTGRVQNMGGGNSEPGGGTTVPIEESQKGLETAMGRLGLSPAESKVAASGRTN